MSTSQVEKRSIVINGHKTSVSLEESFWNGLKEIAAGRRESLREVVEAIEKERSTKKCSNLSSAIRLFVLAYYQKRAA